jgi:hypothetical protein
MLELDGFEEDTHFAPRRPQALASDIAPIVPDMTSRRIRLHGSKQLLTATLRLELICERLNLLLENGKVALYGSPDLVEVYPEVGVTNTFRMATICAHGTSGCAA